jgi:hypothetical protein
MKLMRTWKELIVTYFNVLPRNLLEENLTVSKINGYTSCKEPSPSFNACKNKFM